MHAGGQRFDPARLHLSCPNGEGTRTLKTEDINKTSKLFITMSLDVMFLEYQNARSRYEGRTVDALALGADEGRDEQRYASGSSKHALIRGFPNGGTHHP